MSSSINSKFIKIYYDSIMQSAEYSGKMLESVDFGMHISKAPIVDLIDQTMSFNE